MNHAAVRSVSMRSLNRQRANIFFSTFLEDGRALTPLEVSKQERIFEWDGVLRWKSSPPLAKAKIGVALQEILSSLGQSSPVTGATRDAESLLVKLLGIYALEDYLLWYSYSDRVAYIVLKGSASPTSQLKAWAQGLVLAHRLHQAELATGARAGKEVFGLVEASLLDISKCWDTCTEQLKAAGWDVDIAVLETAPGTRIRVD